MCSGCGRRGRCVVGDRLMLERQVQDMDGVAEAVVKEDVSLTSPAAQYHHTCFRELPQPDTLQHAIRKKGLPVKISNLRMSLPIPPPLFPFIPFVHLPALPVSAHTVN